MSNISGEYGVNIMCDDQILLLLCCCFGCNMNLTCLNDVSEVLSHVACFLHNVFLTILLFFIIIKKIPLIYQ